MKGTLAALAVVVYAVPSGRLKPLLPRRLRADGLPSDIESSNVAAAGDNGGDSPAYSLVATVCAELDLEGRLPPLQLALHVALAHRGERSVLHIVRSVVHPPAAGWIARLLSPTVAPGRRPADARGWVLESGQGRMQIDLVPAAEPGLNGSLAKRLVPRSAFMFRMRGGWICRMPFRISGLTLQPATPTRIRIPYWQELGVVSSAEIQSPLLAAIAPPCRIHFAWPRADIEI